MKHRIHDAKLVVVIDDDRLVLEATGGLLRSWGCEVVAAESYEAALKQLAGLRRPDAIVCDYHLREGGTGIEVIAGLRSVFEIPALLISGDAVPSTFDGKRVSGYHLLQKPLDASRFRAALVGASVLEP